MSDGPVRALANVVTIFLACSIRSSLLRVLYFESQNMYQPTSDPQRFKLLESIIRNYNIRSKINGDGVHELKIIRSAPSARERVNRNHLKEWWLVRYVLKHHKRLGFSAVQGPFDIGPDLRVKLRREWSMAEVEIGWRNYIRHKHHLNGRFDVCRFLIVLADVKPPESAIRDLPPEIIYIDRAHFTLWFEKACTEYARELQPRSKLNARLHIIAGAMQGHWLEICPDQDRSSAACPDCNFCPYFGEGLSKEATPTFERLALTFAEKHFKGGAMDLGNRYDLSRIDLAKLKAFIERHPPSR
jgi:hypothetical protein